MQEYSIYKKPAVSEPTNQPSKNQLFSIAAIVKITDSSTKMHHTSNFIVIFLQQNVILASRKLIDFPNNV